MSWSIKDRSVLVLTLVVSMVVLASLTTVVSAEGKGKSSGKTPPGWAKGEKEGWTSNVPPGIEKKGGWVPPGLSKQEQVEWEGGCPPGWSRGKKEGWTSDIPPGLEKKGGWIPPGLNGTRPPGWQKWSRQQREDWEKDLEEAKNEIKNKTGERKNFTDVDLESALISVEMAAGEGVPVTHAKAIVRDAMLKGMKGEGIERATRAVAYGVGREVDFDQLGKYVHEKLNEGLRDDDLSIEIYKEVTRRHEEKMKTNELIQKGEEKENGS